MPEFFYLPFLAAALSLLFGTAGAVRASRSPATWLFGIGMLALAAESLLTGLAVRAIPLSDVARYLSWAFTAKCAGTLAWLAFSLTYSRGSGREALARWGVPIGLLGLLCTGAAWLYRDSLFLIVPAEQARDPWRLELGTAARALNVVVLGLLVLVLTNLELTFRAAVGTMRWRIKYMVLGVAVILGARLYARAQAILFSSPDIALWSLESGAVVIGCLFFGIGLARTRLAESEVYPSIAVVRSSLTVLIVGGYLLAVGILAKLAQGLGAAGIFQFQAVIVLLGAVSLGLLLLSERLRRRVQTAITRHFSKAQHDSVQVWTAFSERLARVHDVPALAASTAALISETLSALSVTVWLVDEAQGSLAVASSTSASARSSSMASRPVADVLLHQESAFNLDEARGAWADELRTLNPATFSTGGHRLCVVLRSGERLLGAVVLADRVNAAVYTLEELALLRCIAAQMTSVLLGLRQADALAQARELEAFQTMSAFFVHDLKNAAASLNLMLKNLPVHFDDPDFRADALRGIGNTARRIDEMIARLSALRDRPATAREHADLNQVVNEALEQVHGLDAVAVTRDLQPVPAVAGDREQLRSVVANLVLNARDAIDDGGTIHIRTQPRDGRVVLSISDDGCGMSEAFVRESLFRPFQSTKKKGVGIGLFQCRAIVQAHGGGIQVASRTGAGTTFTVTLPTSLNT